jgi:LPS-assembly lipoprotein
MRPKRFRAVLPLAAVAVAVLLGGCGFHLRREANLPASMQRLHIEVADRSAPLARDLADAIERSGAEIVPAAGPGIAVLKVPANRVSTEVLSVGGNARASEYTLRHHVEFEVRDEAGRVLMPLQVVELTREFTFDASQALGVASETDLLTKELERDMVQAILRRLEALGNAAP